jgi:hypothetical protein
MEDIAGSDRFDWKNYHLMAYRRLDVEEQVIFERLPETDSKSQTEP